MFVSQKRHQGNAMAYTPFFQNYLAFYAKSLVHHFRFPGGFCTCKKTPDVLRARGTLFWPKIARELTKSDGTRTIRSEIARGIVSNRSQGPEMDKMRVFDPGVTPGYPGVPRGAPGYPRGIPGYPGVPPGQNLHFVHFWTLGPIGNDSSHNFRSNGPGPI